MLGDGDAQRNWVGPGEGLALRKWGEFASRSLPDGRRAHCSQCRVPLPRRNLPVTSTPPRVSPLPQKVPAWGAGAGVSDARREQEKPRGADERPWRLRGGLRGLLADSWLTPGCPRPQPVRTPLGEGDWGERDATAAWAQELRAGKRAQGRERAQLPPPPVKAKESVTAPPATISRHSTVFLSIILTFTEHSRAQWWPEAAKNLPACRRRRFHPCVEKIPWRRAWPPPIFL